MEKQAYSSYSLGILGGGQLGRMLIQSAIDFNMEVHILDPSANAPCAPLAHHFHQGMLTDYQSVLEFGRQVDIISIEIENVNVDALKALEKEGKKVFPQPEIIEMIQDKRKQKEFYRKNGFPTSDFVLTDSRDELYGYGHWLPAVHKLGKEGYDGRGVQVIKTEADFESGFDRPSVLEKWVPFEKEIAVIVARNEAGEKKCFPVTEMVFHPEHNLVEYLLSPARISVEKAEEAQGLASRLMETMGMVGLLAVEMFLTKEGELLINEMAPRPHNSGHHTIEACVTSQYEQHLRAITGLPLGSVKQWSPAGMVNLLGEAGATGPARYYGLSTLMAMESVHPHFYGKAETKPFRKMGHITLLADDYEQLIEKMKYVKSSIKVST